MWASSACQDVTHVINSSIYPLYSIAFYYSLNACLHIYMHLILWLAISCKILILCPLDLKEVDKVISEIGFHHFPLRYIPKRGLPNLENVPQMSCYLQQIIYIVRHLPKIQYIILKQFFFTVEEKATPFSSLQLQSINNK